MLEGLLLGCPGTTRDNLPLPKKKHDDHQQTATAALPRFSALNGVNTHLSKTFLEECPSSSDMPSAAWGKGVNSHPSALKNQDIKSWESVVVSCEASLRNTIGTPALTEDNACTYPMSRWYVRRAKPWLDLCASGVQTSQQHDIAMPHRTKSPTAANSTETCDSQKQPGTTISLHR